MLSFEELYQHGKYHEMLEQTENWDDDLERIYWKSVALRNFGKYNDALNIAKQNLIASKDTDWYGRYMTIIGAIYYYLNDFETALEYLNKSHQTHVEANDEFEQAIAIKFIGMVYLSRNQTEKAMKYLHEALPVFEKHNKQHEQAATLFYIASCYMNIGEHGKAMIFIEQTNKLFRELENGRGLAWGLHSQARMEHAIGKPREALELQKQVVKFMRESKNEHDILETIIQLGIIYHQLGEFKLALENLQEGLEIAKKINDDIYRSLALQQIGLIYNRQGEFDLAIKCFEDVHLIQYKFAGDRDFGIHELYFGNAHANRKNYDFAISFYKEALTHFEKSPNPLYTTEILMQLITVYTIVGKLNEIEDYMTQFQDIAKKVPTKRIQYYYQFTQGVLYKASKRIKDKVKAQEIFEKIVSETDVHFDVMVSALFHLIELLIHEYKSYGEKEVLNEILDYTGKLYDTAQDNYMIPTIIEALILKAKLSVIQGDFDKAKNLLDQGILIAEEKGMTGYMKQVETEKVDLENQMKQINQIVKTSNFSDLVEKTALLEYIKKAQEHMRS